MEHRKVISIIAAAVLLTCLIAVPALGQPPICQYKGTATLDGLSVAAGTPITAELTNGTQVGATTAYIEDSVSKYNLPIAQVDGVPAEGAALNFYVNGYIGGTSTWNAGGTKTVNLAAVTADVPDISVASSLAFGDVDVGDSDTKTLTISNVGTATLTITDISVTGTQFSVGAYPGTIAAGDWDDVDVTFSPTSEGAKSATLTITSNDPDEGTKNVALSGTGEEAVTPPPPGTFAGWLYETFVESLTD